MKKLIIFCFLGIGYSGFTQNVGINGTASAPDASAMLDVAATDKGLLIPRVSLTSTTDVTTIPSPQTSLLVYNTNTGMTGGGVGFYYYDGAAWRGVGGGKVMVWHSSLNTANGLTSWTGNQTAYPHSPAGSVALEALSQVRVPRMLITRLRITINNNTLNSASTLTIRRNGVSQALTLTIPATTTGVIEATGSVPFSDGDLLTVQAIYGGTGAQAIGILAIELSYY